MIELLLDFLLQLLLYLLRMPILNYLEKLISCLFSSHKKPSLDVLHKSDNFIIVNKPFDILINSDDSKVKPTVQTLLKDTFPNLANSDLFHEFHFANRLDYSTSGVMCIALTKTSCSAAVKAFEKRHAKKYYLALLRGHLEEEFTNVVQGVGEDRRHVKGSHKMCVASDENCQSPRDASTRIMILSKGLYNGKEATKVLIRPHTGRRHQIRVHCQFIGHPIIGDYTYGRSEDKRPYRMFLHSYRLILPNEIEDLDVQSKDPFAESDPKIKWVPKDVINKLEESSFEKINRDMMNEICRN